MKKTILIALLSFSIPVFLNAQDGLSRAEKSEFADADFFFYQERYTECYQIVSELHKNHGRNPEISFRLGVCELELDKDISRSKKFLEFALQCGIKESKFHLGRISHQEHKFEEALDYFKSYQSFSGKEVRDEEVVRYINSCESAKLMMSDPQDVLVINLGEKVNSKYSEYIPVITTNEEEMYFTSRRDNSTGGKMDVNNKFFEDIYYTKKGDAGWESPTNKISGINTNTHDATAAISSDGTKMVVYRTNRQLTGGDLYITTKVNDKWKEPELLDENINSPYQEASACFSPDGETIYFSSNRPGGYGGRDLYRVKMLPNGEWSLPKNLGEQINTSLNEDSPFLDVDNRTLYFSSEGHKSMGGFDIFRTKRRGKENWTEPENIGFPANSVGDDIYLSITPGGRKGYYSSEMENGFGGQDIYEINFIYRQKTNLVVKGQLVDPKGNPVYGEVSIIEKDSRELQGIYTSNKNTGKFIMLLNPMVKYKAVIQADGKDSRMDEYYFEFPEDNKTEIELKPITLN